MTGTTLAPSGASTGSVSSTDRLTTLFRDHFDLVWRAVRRLGVVPEHIDDAVQEVFVVASRRLDAIETGKEKAFLFGVAVRVAADARRTRLRRRRTTEEQEQHAETSELVPSPAELLDHKRARTLLDDIIARLPDDVGAVFMLFELEGLTMAEIASCLDLPAGTVASRLRRAREAFGVAVARLDAARKARTP